MKFMRGLARWSRLKQRSGALMRIARALRVFVPMLGDVTAGRYRPVPWAACGWMTAAVAYLIMPFDIIPDFLMLIGVIDDVFIVGWLLTRVDHSLAPYRRWKGIDPPDAVP
ncbi:DUF1232 domain-containing protein [Chromohalobacter sp. TMW 2.2308]|uniref:DUF1232 domain-containing protein n=1 Tax=Chromohalobacter moromii TaxID=2860329 RepID=A0A9X2X2S7_9GAMM|nr:MULTISPECIES: YkvA family protein [Chromohalobacter]MCK2042957.1 DUF1232 domain-containing protein [Chromohalobacter moromii]MCK2045156.1 DUF1232 domain-containing protein [Chromohalobacter moromii]MCT8505177.1 DUF1232 domain-containing protein [Chromohalobacter moromii]MCT8514523.1 DUF1232 domain-containing protein [Chromohalobacter sp. TMW 2.2271]